MHAAVANLSASIPRAALPLWIVHGNDDGLVPTAFTSAPYVEWLRENRRKPRYWRVPHAQHFDAFLPMLGFGDLHVPLLPYGYAALDAAYAHLTAGAPPLPRPPTPSPRPRGAVALSAAPLDLGG